MKLSNLTNRNVIVTGGAGFIGSHLTKKLVELGARVTVIDTHCTLPDILRDCTEKIQLIQADITDAEKITTATEGHEIIFHCAAIISTPLSFENPLLCARTNILGTAVLLEAARKNNIQRFIFSSSAAVYGATSKPCSEQDQCTPTSPYGFSKLHGELLCKEYTQLYGLPTLALRYFNVFGQGQNGESSSAPIYARFRQKMMYNEPVTFFGTGNQTRDFVPVHDVIEANLLCATAPLELLKQHDLIGGALNVGSGTNISLLQLFENLKREFPNYHQEPIFMPARAGDVSHSTADCSRLSSLKQHCMVK